jgi:hypothetical protein
MPAQGGNPGNPAGKTDPRSEGTPHDRVPRTSTPAHPMRCSFRTHLFSRMRFPGLAPWAGMRCPLQGNLRFLGRCPAWYALPRWGNLNNGISDPASMPQRGIAFQRVGAAPLEPIDHHVSDPMPQRGIAYQPRVPTLGLHPEKQTRVLKERRIAACLGRRPRPTLCGVPSEHTFSLGCGSQGWHPGLVCVAPLGQIER